MTTRTEPGFPAPAVALGALLLVTLVAAGAGRWLGMPPTTPQDSAVVAERALRFVDRADGGIDVLDAASGAAVARVAPGRDGFVRAAMRGLAQERRRRDLGSAIPFLLSAHADGRLLLRDPGTGRQLELESFGATNAAAFARMLPHDEVTP